MDILRNHIGEVEGLQVGFMVIGIEPLHKLDQKLIEESLSPIIINKKEITNEH